MSEILITKADGTQEPFDQEKLVESLKRSGAPGSVIDSVVSEIQATLKPFATTTQIYRHAFTLLRKRERKTASRYSLRRALFDLGPTGFPFEDFIAEIYRLKGYDVKTRVTLPGACASHEVDIVAERPDHCFFAELKFHNKPGIKTDIKIALYVHARIADLVDRKRERGEVCPFHEGLLITNTKFTKSAISYASCSGLPMIGWNYPAKGHLQDLVEETGVEPITVLTSLSVAEKRLLLERGMVMCKNLLSNPSGLKELGFSDQKINTIFKETEALCGVSP